MYSDLYIKRHSFPIGKIIASFVALALVGTGVYYGVALQPFGTQASQGDLVNRQIVNLSFNQAGVVWETEEAETGWVVFGTSPDDLTSLASDERDTGTEKAAYRRHFAMLKNLQPDTEYFYQIVTDQAVYTADDGEPFVFRTPAQFTAVGASKPAYGRVTLPSGEPAANALVTFQYPDAYPLVTYTKMTGEWLIPIRYVVTEEGMQPLPLQSDDTIMITVETDLGEVTEIQARVDATNPFPQTLVIGNQYDYTKGSDPLIEEMMSDQTEDADESEEDDSSTVDQEQEESQRQEDLQPVDSESEPSVEDPTPTLTPEPEVQGAAIGPQTVRDLAFEFPKQDAVIPGGKPLIKGTGVSGTRVQIQLSADPPYSFTSLVDEDGEWIVRVPKDLLPGQYTLTLSGMTLNQGEATLFRSFTIAKSGENVLGEATESGQISEPDPTDLPAPTDIPDPIVPVATELPTLVPTAVLQPTVPQSTSTPLPSLTQARDPADFDLESAPTKEPSQDEDDTMATGSASVFLPTATPIPPVSGTNGLLVSFGALGLLIAGAVSIFFL